VRGTTTIQLFAPQRDCNALSGEHGAGASFESPNVMPSRASAADLFARLEDPPLTVASVISSESAISLAARRRRGGATPSSDPGSARGGRARRSIVSQPRQAVEHLEHGHVVELRQREAALAARSSSSTRFFVTWKSHVVNLQRSESAAALEHAHEDFLRRPRRDRGRR
jgi:hypothetical protein